MKNTALAFFTFAALLVAGNASAGWVTESMLEQARFEERKSRDELARVEAEANRRDLIDSLYNTHNFNIDDMYLPGGSMFTPAQNYPVYRPQVAQPVSTPQPQERDYMYEIGSSIGQEIAGHLQWFSQNGDNALYNNRGEYARRLARLKNLNATLSKMSNGESDANEFIDYVKQAIDFLQMCYSQTNH